MRKSSCCGAAWKPHAHRRKRCAKCGGTFTIRPQKRGRKPKRQRDGLARLVLRNGASLRGLAETRLVNRETLRRRFHTSVQVWRRAHPLPPLPAAGPLIAIADALWFQTKNHQAKYGAFGILLRPAKETKSYLAVLTVRKGRESKTAWQKVFHLLPSGVRKRICALVADGFTGLYGIAADQGWHFQWCHVHLKRRLAELRGLRQIPGREIRRQAVRLIHEFLETPSESRAAACQSELKYLFSLPECPATLPSRLSGVIRRAPLIRTYRQVPELNLPISTNSMERINAFIRERFGQLRGVNSERAMKRWIEIIHRQHPEIQCRGYKETLEKNHRISVS